MTGEPFRFMKNKPKIAKIRSHTHWWIWEGWREEKFELIAGKSVKKLLDPVYIHFDFDDYKPDLMLQKNQLSDDDPVIYYIYRMVPPGKTLYFYTSNHELEYANDQPKIYNKIKLNIKHIEFDEVLEDDGRPPDSDEEEEETIFNYSLSIMNVTSGKTKTILDENYNSILRHWKPRPSDKIYIRPRNRRPRTPWTFPISIFRDYQIENDEILNKWFEFDWSWMKFPKMTDEEQNELKEELRKGYKVFKIAYKYLSGIATGSGGVFSIPLNAYTDFVKQIDLVNGKDIRFAESDTQFLTMNKRSKNSYLNPGVALIRFQFLEILVRLALKRYEETGITNNKAEAVKLMYEKNLIPFYSKDDPQKFRDNRYWNGEVDNIFKSHLQLFEYLFKTYGGTHMKPGDQWFMTSDELEHLFADAELINDQLASRDIAVLYNLSMMTQVDEINKDRHLRMNFIEFLEAFGRWSEQISADPFEKEKLKKTFDEEKANKDKKKARPGSGVSTTARADANNEDIQEFEQAVPVMSMEERITQPLSVKIENILPRIYINWTNNAFKEKWEWPQVDPYIGLYIDKSKKKGKITILYILYSFYNYCLNITQYCKIIYSSDYIILHCQFYYFLYLVSTVQDLLSID